MSPLHTITALAFPAALSWLVERVYGQVAYLVPNHTPESPSDVQRIDITIDVVNPPHIRSLDLIVTVNGEETTHSCATTGCDQTVGPFAFDSDVTYFARAIVIEEAIVESKHLNIHVSSIFPTVFGTHPNIVVEPIHVVNLVNDLSMSGLRTEIILDDRVTNGTLDHILRTDEILSSVSNSVGVIATIWGPRYEINGTPCDGESPAFRYPERSASLGKWSMLWFIERLKEVIRRYGAGQNCISRMDQFCGRIRVWQIGNEVYGSPRQYFWGTREQYVDTLNEAYHAIKKIDPEAIVVPGGIPGLKQPAGGPESFPAPPSDPSSVVEKVVPPLLSDAELCGLAKNASYDLGYVWRHGVFDHYIDIHVYDFPESIREMGDWVRTHLQTYMKYESELNRNEEHILFVSGILMSETANPVNKQLSQEQQASELVKRYMFSLESQMRYLPIVQAQWHGPYHWNDAECESPRTDTKALRCGQPPNYTNRKSFYAYLTLRTELAAVDNIMDRIDCPVSECESLSYVGSCDPEGMFFVVAGGVNMCVLWNKNNPGPVTNPCGLSGLTSGYNFATNWWFLIANDTVNVDKNPILIK